MIEIGEKVYFDLQKHLDKMPVGYPSTESGVEIKLLKILFTPEEALIALKLSFFPQDLKKIHRKLKKTGFSPKDLEGKLTLMQEKGTILVSEKDGIRTYSNAALVVGMYEFQLGRLTPDLVKNVLKYFDEAYIEKEYNATGIPQLRTIPIEKAVSIDIEVSSYDRIRTIIEESELIGLMNCICRQAHDLISNPCKTTELRETCLTFGPGAEMFHERGQARYITKEEALELVKQMEDVGLVAQPSNSQRPFVVCNCCSCCCEVLSNQKKTENPAKYFATNFHAEVNPDDCIGCGVCENRCPMDAITISEEISQINLGRCIGCGLCIPNCSQNAIILKKNAKEVIPPVSTSATYIAIMNRKAEIAQSNK